MTYKKMLELAYPTYERFRSFRDWAMAHCEGDDAQTRMNISKQHDVMYAEVQGQANLIARMLGNTDGATVYEDLKAMYEERHG